MKKVKAKQAGAIVLLLAEIAVISIISSMRDPSVLPWIQPDLFPFAKSAALALVLILFGATGYWLDKKQVLAGMPRKTSIVFSVLVVIVWDLFWFYG